MNYNYFFLLIPLVCVLVALVQWRATRKKPTVTHAGGETHGKKDEKDEKPKKPADDHGHGGGSSKWLWRAVLIILAGIVAHWVWEQADLFDIHRDAVLAREAQREIARQSPENCWWTLRCHKPNGTEHLENRWVRCEGWGEEIIFAYDLTTGGKTTFILSKGQKFGAFQNPGEPTGAFSFERAYSGRENTFSGKWWTYLHNPETDPPDGRFALEKGIPKR